MHVREPFSAIRIVASPSALDRAVWPEGVSVLRTAADEVLAIGEAVEVPMVDDPHAIAFPDSGWVGFRVSADSAARLMACRSDWPAPSGGFAQGMIAGLAVKVLVDDEGVLLVTAAVVAAELEDRLDEVWDGDR